MNTPHLLGLGFTAQVGKDTIAANLGPTWKRVGFGDGVRDLALAINPRLTGNRIHLTELINHMGWETAKEEQDVRQLLQGIGHGARKTIHRDIWLDLAFEKVSNYLYQGFNVVLTDVRYPNEADSIKTLGGTVVQVLRKGSLQMLHPSENQMNNYPADHTIHNNGTIEKAVAQVLKHIGERKQ